MKKITIVSLCSLAFLFVCSVFAVLTKNLFSEFWIPLLIGIGILLVSGILALAIKEKTEVNLACFTVSAIAMGFLIRSWYILRGLENSLLTMSIVSLLCVLYLWIYFAITRIPFVRKTKKAGIACTAIYFAVTLAVYIYFVFTTKTNFLSTLGYYMFIESAFIFAMAFEVNTREELIRNLALSTYSVFVVAVMIGVVAAMAALGDGDCDLDCCDADCCCDGADFSADIGEGMTRKNKGKNKPNK